MANKKNNTKKQTTKKQSKDFDENDDFTSKFDVEINILSLIAVSIIIYIIIFSKNGGLIGDFFKGTLSGVFGVGLLLIPLAFIYFATVIFKNHSTKLSILSRIYISLLILSIMTFTHLILNYGYSSIEVFELGYLNKEIFTGGFLGAITGNALNSLIGKIGSFIFIVTSTILLIALVTRKSILDLTVNASSSIKNTMGKFNFKSFIQTLFSSDDDYYDDIVDYEDSDYYDDYEDEDYLDEETIDEDSEKSKKNKKTKNNPVNSIEQEMEEYKRQVQERERKELERLKRIEKKYKKAQKAKKPHFKIFSNFSSEHKNSSSDKLGINIYNIGKNKNQELQDEQDLYEDIENENIDVTDVLENINTENMSDEELLIYNKLENIEKAYDEVKEELLEFYIKRKTTSFGKIHNTAKISKENNAHISPTPHYENEEITNIELAENVEVIEKVIENTNLSYYNLKMPSEIYENVMNDEDNHTSYDISDELEENDTHTDDVIANLYNDIKNSENDEENYFPESTESYDDENFNDELEDILEENISLDEQNEIYEDVDTISDEFEAQKKALEQFENFDNNINENKDLDFKDDDISKTEVQPYDSTLNLGNISYKDNEHLEPKEEIYNDTSNITANAYKDDKPLHNNETTTQNLQETQKVETINGTSPIVKEDLTLKQNIQQVDRTKPFTFPSFDILNKGKKDLSINHTQAVQSTSIKLEETLESFGVKAKVISVSRGPSVTRYEVQPGVGVKVSKIANLSDDLALNLAAQDIRIQAPIPGKRAVGIEVPNDSVEMVYLREILDTEKFQNFDSNVAFGIGKDIAGNVVVHDIAKMPHLLVAGATGSGKSVCINTLITSILYKSKPSDVKLIMIDPKVVELSIYNGIPHLLIPVVTDPKKANAALQWAVVEMEKRFANFSESNVRNLSGYNEWLKKNGYEPLPSIVIIIDELADLMMTSGKEVEDSICRLAQKARAAGIHLIVATQRPSVDVITGLIKANIPSRLAFAVSSGTDSRTILDTVGAERLLGKGDMLFSPMGSNEPIRIQGAFVSDNEVESIVEHLKSNGGSTVNSDLLEEITSVATKNEKEKDDEAKDALFYEAMDHLIERNRASTSMLQTKFSIGYNRASRLIATFEEAGYIGPQEGSKPRKILITLSQWEDIKNI